MEESQASLTTDLITKYKGVPQDPDFISKIDKLCPEFQETLYDFATEVPEFGYWEEETPSTDQEMLQLVAGPSERARKQIQALFFGDKEMKDLFTDRRIGANLRAMVISFRSRLKQIDGNPIWAHRKKRFEIAEDARVTAARTAMQQGETRLYYPAITRRPFVSSTNEEFNGRPGNFAKVIQRIMTDPTNRVVIAEEKLARSPHTTRNLIVDPRMLTDRQLENLGVRIPKGKRMSRTDRLEYKDEAIPHIKERLSVLREIGADNEHDRFGLNRVYASPDGDVVGVTNITKGKPTIYKTGLLNAIRGREHARLGYSPETRKLLQTIGLVEDAERKISQEWKALVEALEIALVRTFITEAIDELKNVRNEDKKEAKELLQQAVTLGTVYCRTTKENGIETKEWKIKLNPGAKRAQLNKALRKLRKRLNKSIPKISSYVSSDSRKLDRELARHEVIPFRKLYEHILVKSSPVTLMDFGRKPNSEKLVEAKQGLQRWKNKFKPKEGDQPFLEPYNGLCALVNAAVDDILSASDKENCTMAELKGKTLVLQSHLTLHRIWAMWENAYDDHLGNNKTPFFTQLAKALRGIHKTAVEAPQTDETQEMFTCFYKTAEEAIEICQEGIAASREKDEKRVEQTRLALKNKMKEADLSGFFQRPPSQEEGTVNE